MSIPWLIFYCIYHKFKFVLCDEHAEYVRGEKIKTTHTQKSPFLFIQTMVWKSSSETDYSPCADMQSWAFNAVKI